MLFFDERFNYVGEGSTALRVQQAGNNAPPLAITDVKAPKNGYVYIYVSNQDDEHVYFDNIQVTHERGRIIEEDHYYAYGLKIAGISSVKLPHNAEGHIGNYHFYNDKELVEDADLDWYDYGFRFYDPQIGRFPQLDPLTFEYPYYTPYQYAGCEPIANVDLDGLEPLPSNVVLTASERAYAMTVVGTRVASKVGMPAGFRLAFNLAMKSAQIGLQQIKTVRNGIPAIQLPSPSNPLRSVPSSPGKVIPMKPKIGPGIGTGLAGLSVRVVAGAAVGTIAGVLMPLDAGQGSARVLPREQIDDEIGQKNQITLYRGVHSIHPDIENAKKGIATPWGGDATPEQHNLGNNNSGFTSWTVWPNVAHKFGSRKGLGGIVLKKKFSLSELIPSPDKFMQGEVLIRGVVTGATPLPAIAL